jgi:HPt (histidine-containing phosphotransfer) domain-containing protein
MTANALEGDREKCIAAGMNDYATKPIRRAALAATLAKWLKPGGDAASSADARSARAPRAKTVDLENTAFEQLRELFGGDLSDIVETYLSDTPGQISSIAKAIEQDNYEVLGRAAHSLKSSSRSLGAREVGEVAAELEALARAVPRNANDKAELANRLGALRSAFAEIEPQLRAAIDEKSTDGSAEASAWSDRSLIA